MRRASATPELKREVQQRLRNGERRTDLSKEYAPQLSRATIYRWNAELALTPVIPAVPPGTPEELGDILTILFDTETARVPAAYRGLVEERVRNIAVTALQLAKADDAPNATMAEALRALRRVEAVALRLDSAVAAVPDPLRQHLVGRLKLLRAWSDSAFKRTLQDVIHMVEVEARDQLGDIARGPGTLRRRLIGDAFGYLTKEALGLLKAERPEVQVNGDSAGVFADLVTALWRYSTGLGADGIPSLEERLRRVLAGDAKRQEAWSLVQEAGRRASIGLPSQEATSAGDAAHAHAARVGRGTRKRKSHQEAKKA
jgi:hypothetical protein